QSCASYSKIPSAQIVDETPVPLERARSLDVALDYRAMVIEIVVAALLAAQATPQAAAPPRPAPPTRDPNTPGFVSAKELPDGSIPSPDVDGNFIIGPTHTPAPEMTSQDAALQGSVYNFTMSSADSRIYPGIARDAGTFGSVDPADPARLLVTTRH